MKNQNKNEFIIDDRFIISSEVEAMTDEEVNNYCKDHLGFYTDDEGINWERNNEGEWIKAN